MIVSTPSIAIIRDGNGIRWVFHPLGFSTRLTEVELLVEFIPALLLRLVDTRTGRPLI
jgi:hypothetical protein